MEYRNLGKSGIRISALSLGSWVTFGKQIGDDTAEKLMEIAYESGVNFFDNAEVYAHGESEKVMGRILKKKKWPRDSYMISSKAYFGTGGEWPTQRGLSRKHLVEACHAALKRLKTDYLDFYFCHRPDKHTPVEETVWTMHNLIVQGKILYWGTSEWGAREITEAFLVARENRLIPPLMEQPQYNMLVRDRFEVEYHRLYRDFGLGTTIWSPLASGFLTGKYNDGLPEGARLTRKELAWLRERNITPENIEKVRKLGVLARELDISLPQMAIAWTLKNPDVSTVILGASKTEQLKENLDSLDKVEKLDDEVMQRIENILDNKPGFPPF